MNCFIRKIHLVPVLLMTLWIPLSALAQQNFYVEPKKKQAMLPAQSSRSSAANISKSVRDRFIFIIDSLQTYAAQLDSAYGFSVMEHRAKDSIITSLQAQMQSLQSRINDSEIKMAGYKGENLKLDQSNRILIIFNSVVGVLLLLTLVWYLRNMGKKKSVRKAPAENAIPVDTSAQQTTGNATPNFGFLDHKLDQLERLNKLKNSGAITEEEFNRHKQDVLGRTG